MTVDEDATQAGAADAPPPTTEIDPAETAGVGPLAYSEHTTSMPVAAYQPPRFRVWWRVAAMVAAILAVSIAVVAVVLKFGHRGDIADAADAVPPASTSAAVQPDLSAEQRQDSVLFALLDKYRISYVHRADAISTARSVCEALDKGQTFGSLETALIDSAGDGVWGVRDSDQFLDASIEAYCPQYRDLVPPESLQGPFDGSLRDGTTEPPAPPATPNAAPVPTPVAAPAPPPAAANADDQYWSALVAAGLSSNSRAGSIGQGHTICVSFDDGTSYPDLMSRMGTTPQYSAGVIRTAVTVLCPSHTNLLP